MAITLLQKQSFIIKTMTLARKLADIQQEILSFTEERIANDLGNSAVITQANIDATSLANGLTQAELVSGMTAVEAVGTAITTNKTNLYKVAAGN